MFGSYQKSDYKEAVERPYVVMKTTKGDIEMELYAKECPETVWNFINLAEGRQKTKKEGAYYNGIIFHRVIEGFMIQSGCPQGQGTGGPGYEFKDEFHQNLKHDSEGILSMANRGPATNGSQFFITLGPTPHLNGRHTVFGKVVKGMDVVKNIGSVETDHRDRPVLDVVIKEVIISRGPL